MIHLYYLTPSCMIYFTLSSFHGSNVTPMFTSVERVNVVIYFACHSAELFYNEVLLYVFTLSS